jgi:hypothetical protein
VVLFANGPRLHRDAMAAALSARGREAGVALPDGWSVADALDQLRPAVLVCSGSQREARQLSRVVAVAHLDGDAASVLTTYRSGSLFARQSVHSFNAIAEELENLAGAGDSSDRASVVRL